MSTIYVIGHVNPDIDAIASAMGYAWLLASQNGDDFIAARAGPINAQTAWALERLDLKPPIILTDASPRFEAVARRFDTVTPDRPLREAWTIVNRTGTVAPLVETDGTPVGLVTGLSLFRSMSQFIGTRPETQEMSLSELFNVPSREAADVDVPKFRANSRIRDGLPRVLRGERNNFWVIDNEDRYVGVCRQRDLLNPPRLQLILVDHNEVGQSIGSLDEADLIEVLDHHRVNNPPTRLPISFRVDPVGSTSTLVSERIEESGLSAPPELAGLLLGGVLSDTLRFSSPTTTERDREAAERLARWAFVGGSPLEGEGIDSFGLELLQSSSGLSTRDPKEIVTSDLKVYDSVGLHFGIAQVEVTDLVAVGDYLEELCGALQDLIEGEKLNFAMLMVTDIVDGSSRLLMRSEPPVLSELPYKRLPDGTMDARGVVSRKKQLLPVVLALLEA
ncbi:MAG: DHHA2 domain-containing protein [Anaerolineales bacterium]